MLLAEPANSSSVVYSSFGSFIKSTSIVTRDLAASESLRLSLRNGSLGNGSLVKLAVCVLYGFEGFERVSNCRPSEEIILELDL